MKGSVFMHPTESQQRATFFFTFLPQAGREQRLTLGFVCKGLTSPTVSGSILQSLFWSVLDISYM